MINFFHKRKKSKIPKSYTELLKRIRVSAEGLKPRHDEDLKQEWLALKVKYQNTSRLEDSLIDHYALTSEAIRRTLGLQPFDSQILAGIFLQERKIVEMKTGEGKTLSAVFSASFCAQDGKGVHILTFNDYLAQRDAEWMNPVYEFLGLSVGFISEKHDRDQRKKSYACDITYVTAREAGFDFLRDNLVYAEEDKVHRGFNIALIDEIDSILIDEARVPLVISKNTVDENKNRAEISDLVSKLSPDEDFETNLETNQIYLTEKGQGLLQEALGFQNLYQEKSLDLLNTINLSLHVHFLLHRDIDYIVRNSQIEQVDEFTGRVVNKRRWPDGLQAAIEAKEHLKIHPGTQLLGSITLKKFLEQYNSLTGMTGTAVSSETEFRAFYNLPIIVLPTQKPVIREDLPDIIFLNREAKNKALLEEILKVNATGQPILVGTGSVEESEKIGQLLTKHGLHINVLNAKSDSREARIISQAGKPGAITISTAMAGRGTDIKLGGEDEAKYQQVKALGGLYVIGTCRHESKRIDNQLRGRAGRQGDPGKTRFFFSLEDDLLIQYGIFDLVPPNYGKDKPYHSLTDLSILKTVDTVQKKIEEQHFKIRKTLDTYGGIIENQREIIQENREDILKNGYKPRPDSDVYHEQAQLYDEFSTDEVANFWKMVALLIMDNHWSMHLHYANEVKESIHLSSLAGLKPSNEFKKITAQAFIQMMDQMDEQIESKFQEMVLDENGRSALMKLLSNPSATYTELISDQPFGEWFELLYISTSKTDFKIMNTFFWPILSVFRNNR